MQPADLRKEIAAQRSHVAALRMRVTMRKEKGTHILRQAKKQLARMLTVLSELEKKSTVSID